jgi:hypothetical protein
MGVRVKIEIKAGKNVIQSSAVLNTGFESDAPEVLIPFKIAEALGLHQKPKTQRLYQTADMSPITLFCVPRGTKIRVVAEGKKTRYAPCVSVISERQNEILLSDKVIETFKIEIINAKKGLWRFRGEKKIRYSPVPQYW